jgi:hypothetical protein
MRQPGAYSAEQAYGSSKLAQIQCGQQLQARLGPTHPIQVCVASPDMASFLSVNGCWGQSSVELMQQNMLFNLLVYFGQLPEMSLLLDAVARQLFHSTPHQGNTIRRNMGVLYCSNTNTEPVVLLY